MEVPHLLYHKAGTLARLASLMLRIMIFLWFIILHIPIADPHTAKGNEWTSVLDALAFSGIVGEIFSKQVQQTL
jgi:hypothetical protein